MATLSGVGTDHREGVKARDVVALTCGAEVQCLAAGRVIVRDEEGRLALSSFRFLSLGGQAALGAKQPVLLAVHVACLLIYVTPLDGGSPWGKTVPGGVLRWVGFYPIDRWEQKPDNAGMFVARQRWIWPGFTSKR